ncbi:MAG: hypothetical protein EOP48_26595 [Sphingobacteriales bacterium]|nr:MAG: hypothetical protein EOP48_26595 [Sphingobacteriales bacterium]
MKLKTLVFSIDKTKIAEPLKLENCEIGFMTASASDLDKGAKYNNVRIFDGDREALRLQKTYLQSISNNVELLTIKAKELHAHRLELWRDLAIWDSLSLWLNEKSNLYGTRWQRGVEFTFYVSVGFYCIYLATLRDLPFTWGYVNWDSFCKASGTTIKYYFRFLGLTHELNFMEDFKPRAVSYAVDTIGRIFVGYGIYQTAAAFRKYGKGE